MPCFYPVRWPITEKKVMILQKVQLGKYLPHMNDASSSIL